VSPPFCLTSELDAGSIIAQQKRTGVNTLQIVDRLKFGAHQELRAALPGIALVQVIHVRGPESIEEAWAVAPFVNALLLDFRQPLSTGEGTGRNRSHARLVHQPPNPGICVRAGFSGRRADTWERRGGNSPGGTVWNRRVQWRSHRRQAGCCQTHGFLPCHLRSLGARNRIGHPLNLHCTFRRSGVKIATMKKLPTQLIVGLGILLIGVGSLGASTFS